MSRFDHIFAARPMLHLPGWSVFLVALHYHHQISGDRFSWEDLFILAGITCMTAGTMFLNQIFDRKSDALNRKLGFIADGFLTERQMMAAFIVCSLVGLAIGFSISLATGAIFTQALAVGWLYSAPPARLKDRPWLGLLANGWAIGFLVASAVMPEIGIHTIGLLGWDNPFYFFCVVSGVYCLTTIPDIAGDAATGKRTLAVLFSPRVAMIVAAILYALAAVIAYCTGYLLLAGLAVVALLLVIPNLFQQSTAMVLVAAKLPILLLALLAGYFYPGYLVFMIVLIWLTRVYYKHRFNLIYPRLK